MRYRRATRCTTYGVRNLYSSAGSGTTTLTFVPRPIVVAAPRTRPDRLTSGQSRPSTPGSSSPRPQTRPRVCHTRRPPTAEPGQERLISDLQRGALLLLLH